MVGELVKLFAAFVGGPRDEERCRAAPVEGDKPIRFWEYVAPDSAVVHLYERFYEYESDGQRIWVYAYVGAGSTPGTTPVVALPPHPG